MSRSPLETPHDHVRPAARPDDFPPPFPPPYPPPVVHLDDRLIVLDKPEGLLSVPGRGDAGRINVHRWAEAHWGPLGIVHRLDMATSGLLVLARDADALRHLSAQFAQRRVGKRYEALAWGRPQASAGQIDLPLAADWPRRPRQKVCHETGRPALTRWHLLGDAPSLPGADRPCTRWSLEPVTGRSHQLRVHLWALGHPILGDALYGSDLHDGAGATAAGRLMLHASRLSLQHPDSGQTLTFCSPVPF